MWSKWNLYRQDEDSQRSDASLPDGVGDALDGSLDGHHQHGKLPRRVRVFLLFLQDVPRQRHAVGVDLIALSRHFSDLVAKGLKGITFCSLAVFCLTHDLCTPFRPLTTDRLTAVLTLRHYWLFHSIQNTITKLWWLKGTCITCSPTLHESNKAKTCLPLINNLMIYGEAYLVFTLVAEFWVCVCVPRQAGTA